MYNSAYFSPLLCLKSAGLAEYCGKQFIDIWADFFLPARKVSPKLEVETYQVDTDKFIKRGEYQETDVDERKRTVDFLITAVDGSRHEVRFNHPVSLAESRSIQKSKDNPNVYYVTDKALAELEKRYSCTTDF